MDIHKLIKYSGSLLKGKFTKAFLIAVMPVVSELVFRLAEAAAYSLLLYFTDISPLGLFTGDSLIQQISTLIFTVLRWLTTAPLIYTAAYWFSGLSGELNNSNLSELITDKKIYFRSLSLLLWTKFVGLFYIIPVFLFGASVYALTASETAETGILITVHASVMTVITAIVWLKTKIALLAVPFLAVHFPDRSAVSVVRYSLRLMKGRINTLIKLIIIYILPMITIAAIPFLLPRFFSSLSLLVDISVKEDEYRERNNIKSRNRNAADSAKLSHWKKRRFTATSDKT